MQQQQQPNESADSSARAFALVWALAMLFHFNDYIRVASPTAFLWVVGATALFVTGGAPLAWVGLALVQIADLWFVLPMSAASDFFTAAAHLMVLLAFIAAAVRKRSLRLTRGELFAELQPLLAPALLLLFFFAAFHKLNHDFLDPRLSWAPEFYNYYAGLLPFELPFVADATPYLVLLLELTPVVALCLARTRAAGIAVIWGLFLLIGLQGIVQFAALNYAGTALFLHGAILTTAVERFRLFGEPNSAARIRPRLLAAWIVLASCALVGIPHVAWVIVWLLCFVALVVVVLKVRRSLGVSLGRPRLQLPPWYFWPLLLLLLLNESSPYLGVKDWPTFRMYSNLEVDSCDNNHLFVPGGMDDLGDELVTTEETWKILEGYFRKDRELWEKETEWLLMSTDTHPRWSWRPATFAELVAAFARKYRMEPDEVELVYLRRGKRVQETLAELLRRERRHPFERFLGRRPEPDVDCSERGQKFPPRF